MRLVDADALKESIRCSDTDEPKVLSPKKLHKVLTEWIDKRPTIEERKTGRWIRGGSYPHHIFCSACYATYVPNDEWDIWKTDGMDCWRLPRKFCPNCGADMKEGDPE